MAAFDRLNDGSQNAPRLRTQQTLWGLIKLPMNAETEWTLDEKFTRCQLAGFEGVECWLSDENEIAVTEALKRHHLRLALGHRPFKLDDTEQKFMNESISHVKDLINVVWKLFPELAK